MTVGENINGLCHCGCGELTKISTYNFPERGWVKGEPRKYVKGHNGRMSLGEKFWPKILRTETCWLWMGTMSADGYGLLSHERRNLNAHRVSYELNCGPIPEGLHIDHLCRVRACVRPDHLEPVTQAENNRRAGAAKTHCPRGHERDGIRHIHGQPYRYCMTCNRERQAEKRAAA